MLDQFIHLHFPPSTFDGKIHIGCRGRRHSSILPALTSSYSQLSHRISTFHFARFADYYIMGNSVTGSRRLSNHLFSLHNIVIDLDCHDFPLNAISELCNALVFRLNHDVWDAYIPPPTSLVQTGRGLQLWWSITGISGKFRDVYLDLVDFYTERISVALINCYFDDFSVFGLDMASSKNVVGYYRLPTTFNTKANTFATFSPLGTRYDLLELDSARKDYAMAFPKPEKPTHHSTDQDSFLSLSEHRIQSLELLRQLRDENIGAEERNNFCFQFYNALAPCYGHALAYGKMLQFNEGFKIPMTEAELTSVISSAKVKGGYQYSSAKFMEFLSISPGEAAILGLENAPTVAYLSKREKGKLQTKVKKETRDTTIVALYQQDYTIARIAQRLNVTEKTVSTVLKSKNMSKSTRGKTNYDKEKVIRLIQQGLSAGEIAQQCNCSKRTVQRIMSAL